MSVLHFELCLVRPASKSCRLRGYSGFKRGESSARSVVLGHYTLRACRDKRKLMPPVRSNPQHRFPGVGQRLALHRSQSGTVVPDNPDENGVKVIVYCVADFPVGITMV